MENYLDWFNFMSYDIHGVWDSTNKFTGPFILPHTNLTEIKLGLDLMWRNGIDPGYVTLGLGWYGRSFTLSDPSCSTPNGICQFSSGGKPGPCSNSAGTLSNAEIFQVLAQTGAKASFDSTAAVKWITWDTNQWVSYDDGQTMKLKMDAANKLCLGGVMIWSVDQDDTNGTSTSDLLGLGTANGISSAKALELKQNQRYAVSQATSMNSCYWSFCGDSCASGYFPQTSSNGQVNGVSSNTVCKSGELETLCCASGTNMGSCEWEGWNGVGMSCSGGGCLGSGSVAIAFNSNNYIKQAAVGYLKDQTCHGGFQSYCCLGFRASSKGSISSLDLVGLNGKDTNPGLNVGKFAGLTVACTAAATAAGTAAGKISHFHLHQTNLNLWLTICNFVVLSRCCRCHLYVWHRLRARLRSHLCRRLRRLRNQGQAVCCAASSWCCGGRTYRRPWTVESCSSSTTQSASDSTEAVKDSEAGPVG